MKIVSNASPLIFLAKIGKLDLLEDYEVIIAEQVHEEILQGGLSGREDSYKIESLVKSNKIKVEEININKELDKQSLGAGEKAAISLAIAKKINLILLDERKARRIAKFYKLNPRGTIGILFEALKKNKITKKEFRELIQKLIKEGYRISEDIIMELLKEAQ